MMNAPIRCLIAVFILLPFLSSGQQNYVINGDFEYYTSCPNGASQMSLCTGWRQYTNGTSDLISTCSSGNVGAPNNLWGYQFPASGNAYAGGYQYNNTSNYKEYITGTIKALYPGTLYEVSMSVSLANKSKYGTNDLGMFFYDAGPTSFSGGGAVPVIPQIDYSGYGPIMDTANWVRLTGTFIADSTYDNIVIGGFKTSSTITVDSFSGTLISWSYYYFDSVVIKLADSFAFDYPRGLYCAGDTFDLQYVATKNYAGNNTFTVQLSNASGSFSSPVTIGTKSSDTSGIITCILPSNTPTGSSYKIRMVSSSFADTTADYGAIIKIGAGIAKPVATNNGPVCGYDTLKLTATSSTSNVQYGWTGPNGFTSAQQNPEIINPVPVNGGSYIVEANLFGCSSKDTTTVTVHAGTGPTGISASINTPVCAGDTLALTGTSDNSSATYSWTGPNSFASSLQNPVITQSTLAMNGDYILYASDGNCISKDTVTALIKPIPNNFSGSSNSPICIGSTLSFNASTTSSGVSFLWTGPNSFSTNSPTPNIPGSLPIHSGDYIIAATLNGCTLYDTVNALIKPLPVKPVATNNSPFCAGDTIALNSQGSTNNTYAWSGPNSYSSSVQNPAIPNSTVAMSGDYIVTVDSNGCVNKDTTTVTVKPTPGTISLSNNGPICAGNTLQLNSTASSTGVTYAWSGPGNYTANTQNTSRSNSNSGMTGWYKMVVDLNGCTYQDSTYATVHPIPAAPALSYNSPLCVGETLNLTANTVSGGIYSWTGANNFSSSLQNPNRDNMQFGDTGTYKATVTVNGCTSPADSVSVQLNPKPFVAVLANPGDTICNGDPAVFTALPNNYGGIPSYAWYVNNQPAGTGSVYTTSALSHGAVIRAEMTEYTKCSVPFTDSSNDITMTVLPWVAPSVSITADPNRPLEKDEYVKFTAIATDAGNNPGYQWKRNGTNVLGATGNIWSANTLSDNDIVSVEVASSYKCPSPASVLSNSITVKVLTGVSGIEKDSEFKLYPNPARGAPLYLSPKGKGLVVIHVLDITGRVVQVPVSELDDKYSIDVSKLATGSYMLKLITDSSINTFRFQVMH